MPNIEELTSFFYHSTLHQNLTFGTRKNLNPRREDNYQGELATTCFEVHLEGLGEYNNQHMKS